MRYRDLDLRLLRAFVTVARSGGVTAAAHVLGRTQPTITEQLKKLEDALDARLIDRTPGRGDLKLTHAGEALLPKALDLLDRQHSLFKAAAQPMEPLSFGCTDDHACLLSPLNLGDRIDVPVRVIPGMTSQMKTQTPTRYDLVLAVEDMGEADPDRVVATDRLVWIGDRRLSSYRTAPVRLAAHPGACLYRLRGESALRTAGRPFTVAFESTSRAAIERCVLEAGGVSVAPAATLTAPLREVGPDEGFPTLPPVALTLHSGSTSRAPVRRLEAAVRDLLSAQPSATT